MVPRKGRPATMHYLGKRRFPGQMLFETWGFSEPPSDFEPGTYSLRDRERSCRVVPHHAS